jgi:hypothetical protein
MEMLHFGRKAKGQLFQLAFAMGKDNELLT